MKTKHEPVTLEAIENLLDRKLEEKLEQKLEEKLEQKFEEKLKPIKDDIASIHNEITAIKDVTENRIYKELKETRKEMREGFEQIDEITAAVMVDVNDHSDRISRLEKHTGISDKN